MSYSGFQVPAGASSYDTAERITDVLSAASVSHQGVKVDEKNPERVGCKGW